MKSTFKKEGKKSIASKAIEDNDESNDDDDINLMTRTFRNFIKNEKFRNFKDNSEPTYFKCKKPSHIKTNYLHNKRNDKNGKYKKTFETCWEYDSSSSEDEANMCFIAKEVCKTPEYIELLRVFNDVYKKY